MLKLRLEAEETVKVSDVYGFLLQRVRYSCGNNGLKLMWQ